MPRRNSEILEQIPLMRCVAMSLTGDQKGADELVEKALIKVKNDRVRVNGGTNTRIELFSSLHRFARERVARKHSEESRETNAIGISHNLNGLKPIAAAINAIDFDGRSILILRSLGDFTYDELAAISGLSKRDVRSKIANAREEIQLRLAESSDQKQNEFKAKRSKSPGPKLTSGR